MLGPVGAWRGGQAVRLGGPRQRWLLALLLVEPGRAISSDRLIDELWEGTPPAGAEGTLRVYVSRLRSALGDSRLVARPPGYVLDIALSWSTRRGSSGSFAKDATPSGGALPGSRRSAWVPRSTVAWSGVRRRS